MICKLALFVVANTFAVAAVMKVFDREKAADQMESVFHAPRMMAWLTPAIEMLCATGLLIAPQYFCLPSLVLTVVFWLIVAWMIAQRTNQPCHCFGVLSDTAVGRPELVRNTILLCFAVVMALSKLQVECPAANSIAIYIISFEFVVIQLLIPQIGFCFENIKKAKAAL